MQISEPAIEQLIKKYEGLRLEAYRCPANVCTIGYGHTSAAGEPSVHDGMTITKEQAEYILMVDLTRLRQKIEPLIHQPLTQNQYDVVVSFTFNVGVSALSGSSLLKKINTAKFNDVPTELMKWVHVKSKVTPGLVNRRRAEVAWWNKDAEIVQDDDDGRATPDPVPERTMAQSKQGNAALVTVGLGSFGAAKEVVQQAQDAADTANQLVGLLSNTNFLVMSAIVGLGVAIWFWRKRHMEKYGV